MDDCVDVCIATDARFPGGSSSSTFEELLANEAFGISTVFHQSMSTTLRSSKRPYNPKLQSYFRRRPETYVWDPSIKRCRVLFFRQPSVVNEFGSLPDIDPDRIIVIVNHPMRNARGRYDFNLKIVRDIIRKRYGKAPQFLAISPIIRNSYTGGQRRLIDASHFWYNFFSLNYGALTPIPRFTRMVERLAPVVGRHSRDGKEKWPENPKVIAEAYPSQYEIEVLGGATSVESTLGCLPSNWTVHEFGSMDVAAFLEKIDIFVYFHHSKWTEAFGRVIAEAMAAGIPAILPSYFKPLYGDGAICCDASQVRATIKALCDNEAFYVETALAGQALVRSRFGWPVHQARMNALLDANYEREDVPRIGTPFASSQTASRSVLSAQSSWQAH